MRIFFMIGSLLGALAVALGAFGVHALNSVFDEYAMSLWDKATYYQMIHSIMLVITSLMAILMNRSKLLNIAASLFLIGIVCFSGSLYTIALTGIKSFGMIAPIGGFSFIFGWVFLALSVGFYKSKKAKS